MQKLKLLLLLAFGCSFSLSYAQNSRETDSLALVALYNATGGDNWKRNDNWLSDRPLEEWEGIKIQDNSGRVQKVLLADNNLKGELPDELVGLDSAICLTFRDNYLYGNIPLLHTIPFYEQMENDYYSIPDSLRPGKQCYTLTGNLYRFTDYEAHPEAYHWSWKGYASIQSVYANISWCRHFSVDTSIVLNPNEKVRLSFDYGESSDIYFKWKKDGVLLGQSSKPMYDILKFDPALHAGEWECEVWRKSVVTQNEVCHRSGKFLLQSATAPDLAPDLSIMKSWKHNNTYPDDYLLYVCNPEEKIPPVGLYASDDELPEKLVYRIEKQPEHLQVRAVSFDFSASSDKIDFYTPPLLNSAENYLSGSEFTGAQAFQLEFRKKNESFTGTDSVVISVTDPSGQTDQETFYFYILENPEDAEKPVIDYGCVSASESELGIIVKWDTLRPVVKELEISWEVFPYGDNCSVDSDAVLDSGKIMMKSPGQKGEYIIEDVVSVAGENRYVEVWVKPHGGTPEDPYDRVFRTKLSVSLAGKEPVLMEGNTWDVRFEKLTNTLNVHDKFNRECSSYVLKCLENGMEVSSVPTKGYWGHDYLIEPGIDYSFFLESEKRMYISDTIHYRVDTEPLVLSEIDLSWEVDCYTEIALENVLPFWMYYKWDIGKPSKCNAGVNDNKILISNLNAWEGLDTVPVRLLKKHIALDTYLTVLDTFAIITFKASPSELAFTDDTVRLSLKNEWAPFSFEGYLTEGTNADDIHYVDFSGFDDIRFRDDFSQIRPVVGKEGVDILSLKVANSSCKADSVVIVASYVKDGNDSDSPPAFINHSELTEEHFINSHVHNLQTRRVFYRSEPESFPHFDLKNWVEDDMPLEDLKFYVESPLDYRVDDEGDTVWFDYGQLNKEAFEINLDGSVLSITPKQNSFFGFVTTNDFGGQDYESFYVDLIVEDVAGQRDTSRKMLLIAEKEPSPVPETDLVLCGSQEKVIDLFEEYEDDFPFLKEGVTQIYHNYLPTINAELNDENDLKISLKKDVVVEELSSNIYKTNFTSSFVGDYNIYKYKPHSGIFNTVKLNIAVYPECLPAPEFSTIPLQLLETGLVNEVSLWDYMEVEQEKGALFWRIEGGGNLDFSFDYSTGNLRAQRIDDTWEGNDTIWLTAENVMGFTSKVAVAFTTQEPIKTELIETGCGSFDYNGDILDETKEYTYTFKAKNGADSIVILDLTIYPEYEMSESKTVAYGETYQFGTQELTASGTYTETFQTVNGCDSVVELEFTILDPQSVTTEITETACGEFEYNGDILDETKEYTYTFKAENGADSIVVLDLTIYSEYEMEESKTVAYGETYQFGTQELTASGTYTETFQTVNGCDSIVELEFSVLDPNDIKTEITETTCGEFEYNGDILDETKEYTYTFKAENGADSIVILDLTIYPEYETQETKTVAYGETYQFGTQELTVSGTYTETFQTVNGCDSIVELEFTVLDPQTITTEITETACGAFDYNGDILDKTKEYTYTYTAANGADSIVVLDLTIYPEYEMSETMTVDYGETYQFGTQELTVSGTYTETFQTVNGCDSIVELEFTVLDPNDIKTEITETACGEFDYNGDILDETKEYTYTFKAQNGADSIVVLDLTIYPEYEIKKSITVEYGETFEFGGEELTASGTYSEIFKTVHGCDSIVELEFIVKENETPVITLTADQFEILENSPEGTVLATVTATDAEGSVLTFTLEDESGAFEIDAESGIVTVKDSSVLDYETIQELTITISVSDGELYIEKQLTVSLNDIVEVGVKNLDSSIKLYPVPVTAVLNIEATGIEGTYRILTESGVKVAEEKICNKAEINISNLPSGVYLFSLKSQGGIYKKAFVKK